MEPEAIRRQVWDEMLYANMRANYFGELAFPYQSREKWLRVGGVLASSGAAATVLTEAPGWVKVGLPVIAAASGFWLLFSQYGLLARDATELYAGWSSLSTEYERIWNHLDEESEARFYETFERGDALSKAGTKFPYNKKRLEFWLDHAAALATARYA